MSDEPIAEETAVETNMFATPTADDRQLLEMVRPICHQIFHAVRYILEQQAEQAGNEEEVSAETVVYYGLTAAALISTECQGLENEELSTVMEKVNRQCQHITEEHSFPTPIGRA